MSDGKITFEMLNAYVDGELDAATAAVVAGAVARDSELAREVAALSRLRSAVSESFEAPSLSIPTPRATKGRVVAIAASIAFVMLIAGSTLFTTLDRKAGSDWLAQARQIHHDWSLESSAAGTLGPLLFAQYAEAVPGAYLPDLSASRLSLVHAAVSSFAGERQVLLAGYRGTRGCKITLLVFDAPDGLEETLRPFHDGKNEAFGWRAGSLGYVILSDGMDPPRFKLLAETVRHGSRIQVPFDEESRIALRESRDKSVPCTA